MPPWWSQPNQPEPEENTVASAEIEDTRLSEEGRRKAWRLLVLLDALRQRHPEPVSLDEIDLLGRVAEAHYDLHDACAALRNGCGLDHLVQIFT